jgi:hypothetical protein
MAVPVLHRSGAETMIHYNVWFSFKPGADVELQIVRVRALLDDFRLREMMHDYELLKNRDTEVEGRAFQVIAKFESDSQFALPFEEIRRTGISEGLHGHAIENVGEITAEVFERI